MVITMILNLPELLKNQPKHKINLHFKPGKTSLRTELWYRNELLALVRKFRQAVESEDFFANEVNLNDGKFNDDASKDFDADRFLKAVEKLSKADIDSVAKKIAQGLLIRGNAQNIQEVEKDLKRQTRVDLQGYLHNSGKVAEKLEQLTTANVQLIKSIHSQYLDKIQAAVMQAQVKGTLTKDLAKQIQEIGGVTEKRAKLIARDQSAKINASLTRARHEEMGIKQYIWSTSGDERVRDSHAENDGKIFSYDDPPPTGHPGDEINCRCVAIPYFGDKVEQKAEEVEQSQEIERKQEELQFVEQMLGEEESNKARDRLNTASEFIKQHKLSQNEALSVIGYTGGFYKDFNKALRTGMATPKITRYENLLNKALEKLPKFSGISYRAVQKLSKEDLARYKEGEVVTEPFFVSTSELKKVQGFGGKVRFEIYGKNGRKVENLSLYPSEKEVLFKSNSHFFVTKVSTKGLLWWKMTVIELLEV